MGVEKSFSLITEEKISQEFSRFPITLYWPKLGNTVIHLQRKRWKNIGTRRKDWHERPRKIRIHPLELGMLLPWTWSHNQCSESKMRRPLGERLTMTVISFLNLNPSYSKSFSEKEDAQMILLLRFVDLFILPFWVLSEPYCYSWEWHTFKDCRLGFRCKWISSHRSANFYLCYKLDFKRRKLKLHSYKASLNTFNTFPT